MGRKRSTTPDAERYEARRAAQGALERQRSAAGREIGPLPAVAKPKRKARCRKSLRGFCETYLSGWFYLGWSPDHLKAIDRLQTCALKGGQFAFAMFRGGGKTQLCKATSLWATLYAHRSFVVLVGSDQEAADEMLESIKTTLETNDLLLEDFPEICHPVRRLEGTGRLSKGQTLDGVRTRIEWGARGVVLPTVKGSPASGAPFRVTGITGRLRGMSHTRADGTVIRPDFAIVDDPQTDASAVSPSQNRQRLKLLNRAVLGLAGPKSKIACVVPCTVIAPGDMADRTLDREESPHWQGERFKLLYSFPANMGVWDEYDRLRKEGMRSGAGTAAATDFYRQNREAMDRGASPAWPEKYEPDQLSAVQYAMDKWLDDPAAFFAECQNSPVVEGEQSEAVQLDPDAVASRVNQVPRGTVPPGTTRLVCGIDVQQRSLWWVVAGWREDFGGAVVDYGTFPAQGRHYYTARDLGRGLDDQFPGLSESARIYAGLDLLVNDLAGRQWQLERVVIDAGHWTDTVQEFCQRSPHRTLLLASKGYGIKAGRAPMSTWQVRPGERAGRDWRLRQQDRGRHLLFDTNQWKSFVAERLLTPPGGAGCLWLPGTRPADHQLLADHLCAETRTRTSGHGRQLDEWEQRPERPDNHWWDALVLCAVAASVGGLAWSSAAASGAQVQEQAGPKRVKLSEIQRQKRGAS